MSHLSFKARTLDHGPGGVVRRPSLSATQDSPRHQSSSSLKRARPPSTNTDSKSANIPKRRRQKAPKTRNGEPVPLHAEETLALKRMFYGSPAIQIAVQQTRATLFGVPLQVTIGQQPAQFDSRDIANGHHKRYGAVHALRADVREEVIGGYWMPELRGTSFEWYHMFGFIPYYMVAIPNPLRYDDLVLMPSVPPIESGTVHICMAGLERKLVWKWHNTPNVPRSRINNKGEDPYMQFAVESWPTLSGHYTNNLASALGDLQYLQHMQAARQEQERRLANPMHVIEFHPNISQSSAGYKDMEGMNLASEAYPNQLERQGLPIDVIEAYRRERGRSNTALRAHGWGDLQLETERDSDLAATGTNSSYTRIGRFMTPADEYYARNTRQLNKMAQHNSNCQGLRNVTHASSGPLPANTAVLEPYERYVQGANGHLGSTNIEMLSVRVDKFLSALVGFPLEAIMDRTGRSGGSESDSSTLASYMVKRTQAIAAFYAKTVRTMFYQAYALHFQAELDELHSLRKTKFQQTIITPMDMAEAVRKLNISVSFPRTPDINFTDVQELVRHRAVDNDEAYTMLTDTLGLTGRNSTSKPPDFDDALERLYILPQTPEEQLQMQLKGQAQQQQQQQQQQTQKTSQATKSQSSTTATSSKKKKLQHD